MRMRHNDQDLVDWVVVGVIAISLVVFFTFVQHSNNTITGNVVGTAFKSDQSCYSFTDASLSVVITEPYIALCPNTTHHLDYFELRHENAVINCQGSTIDGTGGALFIPKTSNQPRVTLQNCSIENFGGLFQNARPVTVNQN